MRVYLSLPRINSAFVRHRVLNSTVSGTPWLPDDNQHDTHTHISSELLFTHDLTPVGGGVSCTVACDHPRQNRDNRLDFCFL